jgi:phosphoribosylglycinamide formyltransferase-1
MSLKIKIGALISGGGSNLQAVIDACESGAVDGEIVFVGADKGGIGGLDRARRHHIPTFVVDYRAIIAGYREQPDGQTPPADFDMDEMQRKQRLVSPQTDAPKLAEFLVTRAIAEARLLELMEPYCVDLLILAGYMRNLTPYFIDRFMHHPDRPNIMNIHPALLPAFPGIDGYGDTFRYGCRVGGCTVHFIDYGEDSGPIVGQRAFSIADDDDLDAIRNKGLELEWSLYPECIQLFAQNRLHVVNMTHTLKNGRVVHKRVVKIAKDK